jgi:hypothetical protein
MHVVFVMTAMRPFRSIGFLVLFLALLPLGASAACKGGWSSNWIWDFDGSIGTGHLVRMSLVFAGEEVTGVYFHADRLKDIPLKGRVTHGKELVLDEYDAKGQVVARFEGSFTDHDALGRPLDCEHFVGAWQTLGAAERLPVDLQSVDGVGGGSLQNRYAIAGVHDDETIHRRAYQFWKAVQLGDRKTVASLLEYPIEVRLPAGMVRLRRPADLIARYDRIFTDRFRERIANAMPRNMFSKANGIMLGDGQVWFGPDGKVISLNLP